MPNATQSYREVQRKANVGERIKIVEADDSRYSNGDEFVVDGTNHAGVYVKHRRGNINGCAAVFHSEYVVLEPITPTTATLPDLFAQFIRDNAGAVRSYLAEIDPDKCAEPSVDVAPPAPLTRAKVIEMARERVAELERIGRKTLEDLPKGTQFHDRFYRIEFHVNRDKRTVTALARTGSMASGKKPDAVGIAKCAPDDVFNADIGKAIAAERALGLTLTDAFVNAPKPTEKVAGMLVHSNSHLGNVTLVHSARGGVYNIDDSTLELSIFRELVGTRVLDDTDADYTQEVGEAA